MLSCSPAPFCALCCVKLSLGEVQHQREQIKDRVTTQSGGQGCGEREKTSEREHLVRVNLAWVGCADSCSYSRYSFELQHGEGRETTASLLRFQTKPSATTFLTAFFNCENIACRPPAKLVKERQGSPFYCVCDHLLAPPAHTWGEGSIVGVVSL